jgi:hypothetical protein
LKVSLEQFFADVVDDDVSDLDIWWKRHLGHDSLGYLVKDERQL